jgi:allantoicase
VARLRVHGVVVPQWTRFARGGGEVDLAAMENGGLGGVVQRHVLWRPAEPGPPGRSLFMGDGWETRRRRGPGTTGASCALPRRARSTAWRSTRTTSRAIAPERCTLEAIHLPGATADALAAAPWMPLLGETRLQPHARHRFEDEVIAAGPATHVRLNVFPDGGIARLRLFGTLGDGTVG